MHELYNYEVNGIEYLLRINTYDVVLFETDKIDELYNLVYKAAKK